MERPRTCSLDRMDSSSGSRSRWKLVGWNSLLLSEDGGAVFSEAMSLARWEAAWPNPRWRR